LGVTTLAGCHANLGPMLCDSWPDHAKLLSKSKDFIRICVKSNF
jgi:hypothetical protein